jgi:glucose/arabinose dehydrogenase
LVSIPADGIVVALPDYDHDGVVDAKHIIIGDLDHPHGLAFYGNKLFVVTTTQVIRYAWDETTLQAVKEKVLFSLPQNDDHNNRTITFDSVGTMYVSVGSTCNVCIEKDMRSATVMISNSNGDNPHVFAKGLRNAPFIAINPTTGALWGSEMGRDYLGDNLPPDEIDIISDGKDYGWPICYGNKIHDTDFDKEMYKRNPCEDTIAPLYEIPAHSAPLGLAFINSSQFPTDWQNDLLVAYHGSWNKTVPIGYNVVHLKIQGNTITGSEDFLTGFIPPHARSGNDAMGRPVDLIFDSVGNLYISDDKAGNVYIVQKKN